MPFRENEYAVFNSSLGWRGLFNEQATACGASFVSGLSKRDFNWDAIPPLNPGCR
jgi:hypothetical protein